jgi:polyisoprenoid-binding protein YceI
MSTLFALPRPRARFAAGLALLAALASPAQSQQLDLARSEIAFTTQQMGVPVEGRFRQFGAQVAFDPKQPQAARVILTIDLASVAFGARETEVEAARPEWFDVKQFPQARFESSAVKSIGPGRLEVQGQLTLKGTRAAVSVPVTLAQAGPLTTATGNFVLKRLDFRLGDGEWKDTSLVANEVQVRFKLVLSGVAPL